MEKKTEKGAVNFPDGGGVIIWILAIVGIVLLILLLAGGLGK